MSFVPPPCELCERMGILPSLSTEDTAAGRREPVMRFDVPCPSCPSGLAFAISAQRYRPTLDGLAYFTAWRESGNPSYVAFVCDEHRAAWEAWRDFVVGPPRKKPLPGPLADTIARLAQRAEAKP